MRLRELSEMYADIRKKYLKESAKNIELEKEIKKLKKQCNELENQKIDMK